MFKHYSNHHIWQRFKQFKYELLITLCWLTLAISPIATWLKRTMLTHMLVQLGLLVFIGVILGQQLHKNYPKLLRKVSAFRFALLFLAIATMMVWMLPRLLDMAVDNTWVDYAKALSLTLLAGLPLYFSWRNFGHVVRNILHLEALATILRLAWLYIESPTRLCIQYGMDDQKQLGLGLAYVSCIYTLYLLSKVVVNCKEPYFPSPLGLTASDVHINRKNLES